MWKPCECGEFWCTEHQRHVFECSCPPIEEWETSPYPETVHVRFTRSRKALGFHVDEAGELHVDEAGEWE